jgi:hypothetical protein
MVVPRMAGVGVRAGIGIIYMVLVRWCMREGGSVVLQPAMPGSGLGRIPCPAETRFNGGDMMVREWC